MSTGSVPGSVSVSCRLGCDTVSLGLYLCHVVWDVTLCPWVCISVMSSGM